jgi:hypothetical protein
MICSLLFKDHLDYDVSRVMEEITKNACQERE